MNTTIRVSCPIDSDLDKAVLAGGFCLQNERANRSVELHNWVSGKLEVSLFDHKGTFEGLALYSKAQLLRWFPIQVFIPEVEVLSDFGFSN
jgi:hypothetical protein